MDGSDMGDAGALPKDGLLALEGNFVDGIITAFEGELEIGVGDVEVTEITSGRTTRDWGLQSLESVIGTIPQLAQKLVFCNSDLDKSTTVCKIGDLTRLA